MMRSSCLHCLSCDTSSEDSSWIGITFQFVHFCTCNMKNAQVQSDYWQSLRCMENVFIFISRCMQWHSEEAMLKCILMLMFEEVASDIRRDTVWQLTWQSGIGFPPPRNWMRARCTAKCGDMTIGYGIRRKLTLSLVAVLTRFVPSDCQLGLFAYMAYRHTTHTQCRNYF